MKGTQHIKIEGVQHPNQDLKSYALEPYQFPTAPHTILAGDEARRVIAA